MSKIKNGGLDQYGVEPFEQQQFVTAGVEGVKHCVPVSTVVGRHQLKYANARKIVMQQTTIILGSRNFGHMVQYGRVLKQVKVKTFCSLSERSPTD